MRIVLTFAAGAGILVGGVFSACRSPSPASKAAAAAEGGIPVTARIPLSVDEVLAQRDETLFSIALFNLVFAREDSAGYEGLTTAERVIFCVNGLETEVNSGGFVQYFLNSAGDHAGDAPAALRALGAPKTATLVELAIGMFPIAPAPGQIAREAQVAALSNQARTKLELLDSEFRKYPEPLAELARAFVEGHRGEFPVPPNAGGSIIPAE